MQAYRTMAEAKGFPNLAHLPLTYLRFYSYRDASWGKEILAFELLTLSFFCRRFYGLLQRWKKTSALHVYVGSVCNALQMT